MWLFDLSVIAALIYLAWEVRLLKLKVEALEYMYNQLADIIDERLNND